MLQPPAVRCLGRRVYPVRKERFPQRPLEEQSALILGGPPLAVRQLAKLGQRLGFETHIEESP